MYVPQPGDIVKVVALHPCDAFYDKPDRIIGSLHVVKDTMGFGADPKNGFVALYTDWRCFHGVKVEPVFGF